MHEFGDTLRFSKVTTLLETLAACLAALVGGMPLLTLLHELGHGIAAALTIGGRVTIVQGSAPHRLRLSVWRLDIRLRGPVAPHRVMVGWALWGPHRDAWRHAVATVAGPLTSFLTAVACIAGAAELGGFLGGFLRLLLVLVAIGAAFQALSSGLPVRYGRWFGQYAGEASDGLRFARLLQGRPEAAPTL